jgi:hypothetical protein
MDHTVLSQTLYPGVTYTYIKSVPSSLREYDKPADTEETDDRLKQKMKEIETRVVNSCLKNRL